MGSEWQGSTRQLRPTRQQNVRRDSYVRSDSNNVQATEAISKETVSAAEVDKRSECAILTRRIEVVGKYLPCAHPGHEVHEEDRVNRTEGRRTRFDTGGCRHCGTGLGMGAWRGNGAEGKVMVKTKKGWRLSWLSRSTISRVYPNNNIGRQVPHLKEIKHVKEKMKMSRRCILQTWRWRIYFRENNSAKFPNK